MNDLQSLIDQMSVDISSQAVQLDDLRLPRFLAWLSAHSIKVKIAAKAKDFSAKFPTITVSKGT